MEFVGGSSMKSPALSLDLSNASTFRRNSPLPAQACSRNATRCSFGSWTASVKTSSARAELEVINLPVLSAFDFVQQPGSGKGPVVLGRRNGDSHYLGNFLVS